MKKEKKQTYTKVVQVTEIPQERLIAKFTYSGITYSPINAYSARAIKKGKFWTAMMYLSSKYKNYKEDFLKVAKQYVIDNNIQLTHEFVKVVARFYFESKRRKDLSNAGKLEWDALNGLIWDDDSQIHKLDLEKHYDKLHPRVEIEIYTYPQSTWPI